MKMVDYRRAKAVVQSLHDSTNLTLQGLDWRISMTRRNTRSPEITVSGRPTNSNNPIVVNNDKYAVVVGEKPINGENIVVVEEELGFLAEFGLKTDRYIHLPMASVHGLVSWTWSCQDGLFLTTWYRWGEPAYEYFPLSQIGKLLVYDKRESVFHTPKYRGAWDEMTIPLCWIGEKPDVFPIIEEIPTHIGNGIQEQVVDFCLDAGITCVSEVEDRYVSTYLLIEDGQVSVLLKECIGSILPDVTIKLAELLG